MDEIYKGYIATAISLILFGLLLSFVVYVSQTSNAFFRAEQQEREIRKEMMALRELYEYKNKDINGDDILIAVKKYSRIYDVDIELGSVGSGAWLQLDKNGTDSEWDIEKIRNTIGDNIYGLYHSELIEDDSGTVVKIKFTRK